MSRNAAVAALLEEMADHLEARDVDYKPNSYRRAADSVREHTVDVETLRERGGEDALQEIDDVGEAISSKIVEYLDTGEIAELEELREELPVDMDALTAVEGVGPKTVKRLYDALGVETLDDLEAAAEAGEIREVKGFGAKTEENILANIPFAREARARSLLGDARPIADRVVSFFEELEPVERVETAGSLRRWRPTVGDIDVVASGDDPGAVIEAFESFEAIETVLESGTSKASARIDGIQVDLRVVENDQFGAALQYFTGSKDHNVAVRSRAIDRGMKLNEYGLFDVGDEARDDPDAEAPPRDDTDDADETEQTGERIAGETEAGVYAALDMAWIPPELRENRGEVEAAAEGTLPDPLELDDVRGDLHVHTHYSDGRDSIEEMVEAAAAFGHEYVVIADHATGPGMVGGVGLSDQEIREQIAAIREIDTDAPIGVFAGIEANVGPEGGISVGDDVLSELDCVVASPHSDLDGDGTDRLVTAIEHPEVDVIGHPTGRKLNQRPGHDIDIERVAEAAADHGTALEVNADPRRLDLRAGRVMAAIETDATIAINTDAHRTDAYEYVRYGVHTARRGWAEPDDVLNCRDVGGLRDFLGI